MLSPTFSPRFHDYMVGELQILFNNCLEELRASIHISIKAAVVLDLNVCYWQSIVYSVSNLYSGLLHVVEEHSLFLQSLIEVAALSLESGIDFGCINLLNKGGALIISILSWTKYLIRRNQGYHEQCQCSNFCEHHLY